MFGPLSRWSRPLALAVALSLTLTVGSPFPPPAGAALPRFSPPVDAIVVDGYRPPSTPYGPGNRGWDYDTEPAAEVRAAGAGVVSFAGPVGGTFAVTVAHGGGLRTSYSYLADVAVRAGQHVDGGTVVGTTVDNLHFGVRLGDRYVDPAVLFQPGALRERARLLPREPNG